MPEDDTQLDVAAQENVNVTQEVETAEDTQAPEVTQEDKTDYRGKLNATNRFLESQGYTFKDGKWTPPAKQTSDAVAPQMSIADATALLKADVHEDDMARVEKFAKDEGVSIREALKTDELKAILAVRNEKRATAQAANVSNVRRGPTKVSDETLVSDASKGKLPDDDDGIARLIAAKMKRQ